MKANVTVSSSTELLLLPGGQILAHNITPEMAAILTELDPGNELMRQRAVKPSTTNDHPPLHHQHEFPRGT